MLSSLYSVVCFVLTIRVDTGLSCASLQLDHSLACQAKSYIAGWMIFHSIIVRAIQEPFIVHLCRRQSLCLQSEKLELSVYKACHCQGKTPLSSLNVFSCVRRTMHSCPSTVTHLGLGLTCVYMWSIRFLHCVIVCDELNWLNWYVDEFKIDTVLSCADCT